MKTPVWVWDKKQEIYLTLPEGIQQFEDGNWGYTMLSWIDHGKKISDFYNEHKYLFKYNMGKYLTDWTIVLKNTRPQDKHWYSKPQARITKVQR